MLLYKGYEFRVITEIEGLEDSPNKVHGTLFNQIELLNTCLLASMTEFDDVSEDDMEPPTSPDISFTRKTASNLKSLSGGIAIFLTLRRQYG